MREAGYGRRLGTGPNQRQQRLCLASNGLDDLELDGTSNYFSQDV